jgi:hypothetical protein
VLPEITALAEVSMPMSFSDDASEVRPLAESLRTLMPPKKLP